MRVPSIALDKKALSNFEDAIRKEWIVTNGLGGYASSTVLGINTRKYHGLLVAATHPPADRRVVLAKMDEDIVRGNDVYRFGANEFHDGFFPQGFRFLREFSVSPFPVQDYSVNNVTVRKTIFLPNEKNCVVTLYSISNKSGSDVAMRIFPLVNGRHFHSTTERETSRIVQASEQDRIIRIGLSRPESTLLLASTEGHFVSAGRWVERIYMREEASRGESCYDDCYQPGYFEARVMSGTVKDLGIVAVAEEEEDATEATLRDIPLTIQGLQSLHDTEKRRLEGMQTRFHNSLKKAPSGDWLNWLVLATGTFIVRGAGGSQKSVVAGYHWFGSWGRDTFVSLPGLLLVTERFEDARSVFFGFASQCRDGLIPNCLPDQSDQPTYNTVDAALWFVNALLRYLKYTGDFRFVERCLWQMLKGVVESYIKGTRFGVGVDADGLVSHGSQLTWMDASVHGEPVTPRAGKAVEVQALWYNALKTMELLANRFGEGCRAEEYARMAERARRSFLAKFWNADSDCLYDVVSGSERDGSLRPNQIIAVALDHVMLDGAKQEKVVHVVQRELLTLCGLRTLAKSDPRFFGVYFGDRATRDRAYHNGTIWPWLLGPFTTAFLKVEGHEQSRREHAFNNFLKPLFTRQVHEAGLGTISEIFDGETPHAPRGCISQAWSVAEPFRAYVEEILTVRPKYEKKVLQNLR